LRYFIDMTYKVFDSHAHIYPSSIASKAVTAIGDFYDIKMSENGTVEGLLAAWRECGELCAKKCLVHSTATTPHQVSRINDFIAGEVASHSEFVGFGTLHNGLTEEEAFEEGTRMLAIGLKGIKLHPDFQKFFVDEDSAHKIYRAAEGRLPILFHAGDNRYDFSAPERIASIAKQYPNLTIIAAHFGGYRHWQNVEEIYKGLDNVYFDTSSTLFALPYDTARRLIEKMGYERFLFGTDFPMWTPQSELDKFFKLGLSEAQNQAILGENASKLLSITL